MRRTDRRAAPRPALHRSPLARYDDGAGRDELLGVDPAHITMLTRRPVPGADGNHVFGPSTSPARSCRAGGGLSRGGVGDVEGDREKVVVLAEAAVTLAASRAVATTE